MPGKSKHDKGKHHHRSKKSRAKQRYVATALQQPAITDAPTPVAAVSTPPPAEAPASPKALRVPQYPYIAAELRRISILAGIILVVLIVLALVLS